MDEHQTNLGDFGSLKDAARCKRRVTNLSEANKELFYKWIIGNYRPSGGVDE